MSSFDPSFDPYFDSQRELTAANTLASLKVKTSEPTVIAAAGSNTTVPDGYRLVEVPSPSSGSLYVHGDVVRIVGALNLPGQAVEIHARVIEVANRNGGEAPAITVTGVSGRKPDTAKVRLGGSPGDGTAGKYTYSFWPGKDPYTPPTAGNPGAPGDDGAQGDTGGQAGWVDIRAGSLVQIDGATLAIEANGGPGGAGQDGQPGQRGGDGGPGADAWKGGVADIEDATNGAAAGAGGPGGRGGPGGFGGSAGQINVYLLGPIPDKAISTKSVKGAQGPVGNADNTAHPGFADDGPAGTPGAGGKPYTYTPPAGFGDHPVPVTLPGGAAGGVGAPLSRKPPAASSPDTSVDKTPVVAGNASTDDVAFTADGDQLAMLLDNVRTDYLALDDNPDSLASLNARLKWLVVCGAAPASVKNASAVKNAATGILGTLLDPTLDAFGRTRDWAPLASLSQYDSLIGDASSGSACVLHTAESAWGDYRNARKSGQELATACDAALNAASNRITDLTKRRDDAWTQLATLSNDISDMANTVADARHDVLTHLASFKANVEKKVTLSFEKYLDVIEQTAFAASDPPSAAVVGGTEEFKFWKSALTDITGDNGETVSKSYLISRMDIFGDKITTLDEAYDVVDGYIQLKDQDAYKLLCTQEKLEELLDNYRSIDGAKEAEDALAAYVREVQLRNEKILSYNTQASQLGQIQGDLDQLTVDHAKLGAASAGASLPVMDRFVQGLYDRAKQDCIKDLYEMSRAYRFWSLRDYDVFRDVLTCAGPSTVNYLAVSSGHQRIRDMKVDDVNRLVADLAPRTEPVVVTFDATADGVLASLKKSRGVDEDGVELPHFWQFALTPATKSSTAKSDKFTDMADVRLVEVRCWLIGLESAADATGAVKVHLTQRGDETLATRQGDIVSVRHDPVEKVFEYSTKGTWPSDSAVLTKSTYWAPTPPNTLPEHTPIGPFATWRIGVRTQDAAHHIQWNRLKSVRLEFYICWQGFDTAKHH